MAFVPLILWWRMHRKYDHADNEERSLEDISSAVLFRNGIQDRAAVEGLTIIPGADDTAQFALNGATSEGMLTGFWDEPKDGMRSGNFSAPMPILIEPLEGEWIIVNRTEAGEKTISEWDRFLALVAEGSKQPVVVQAFDGLAA